MSQWEALKSGVLPVLGIAKFLMASQVCAEYGLMLEEGFNS